MENLSNPFGPTFFFANTASIADSLLGDGRAQRYRGDKHRRLDDQPMG
jgi:hypothetical protein